MKKLRRTLVPALLCTLLLHPLSFAHGGMEHFLGTVTAISDHFLSLNTSDGAVIRIEFDLETKFTKGGAPATVKDVQVESRVVIHAHKRDNSLHAAEVRIGTGRAHGQH
ncbi:MAG TPA: hypothetical protein VK579_12725 [Terriglobales bacterium]|nr:hypothetical protein [Terriglobales bacterium]